jgi:hypothetical protein
MNELHTAVFAIWDTLSANAAGLLGVLLFVLFVRFAANRLGRN